MKLFNIKFNIVLNTLIFSALYWGGSYLFVSNISHFAYQVVAVLVLIILYINILRLFVFEILNLERTRISEVMAYVLMYLITASALVFPFVFEPVYLLEVDFVRVIIITFASVLLVKYFIYMILAPLHDMIHKINHYRYYKDKKYEPMVSVMIPAWNERVGIIDTIKSILLSTYRKIEIVVVNDGSTDDSDKIIKSFLSEYQETKKDIEIKYCYQENGGKGRALNTAIDMASGDILMTIDADCYVDANAVREFVEEFKNPKVMAAVGNVKIGNKNSAVGMVQYLEFLFSFYFKRAESLLGSIYIIGGAAGAFRREVFEKVGKYSTNNITEDIELTVRLQDAGMKISYVPEAVVYTEGANDLESLKKQRLRWKRGRFQTFFQYWHMFFSTEKHHNKALTFFTMPMAVFSEIQLLFEIPFIVFLYSFSVINQDFTSFFTGVVIVGTMFVVQFMFYDKTTRKVSFIALAPIGWLLFYIATYVEAYALIKSIRLLIAGKELHWQNWERTGVTSAYTIEEIQSMRV